MARILWGSDLYKGAKLKNSDIFKLHDIVPFQMLEQDEKTSDWLHAVADHYEAVGWRNVEKKASRIQRNYWLRHGKLNPSDYLINPTENQYYEALQIALPESSNPLQQFYPIVPTIVDVLRGEFTKRNTTYQVQQIDPSAVSEALEQKEGMFSDAMEQLVITQKQYELARQGLIPDSEETFQQYQQQIEAAKSNFINVESKFKTFRTTGAKWAEKVVKIQEDQHSLKEQEVEGFESSLIADSEFWHLDMGEDNFKLELLNSKWCDYHKGPNKKYVSSGTYFLWFDWASVGDIIDSYRGKIKEDDYEKLRKVYSTVVGSLVVPDYAKSIPGSYYDSTKNWHEATALNPAMNDAILGKELANNFYKGPNFEHNQDIDIFNPSSGSRFNGEPQMFRIMRLYFRSQRKIGWLTKIGRDGSIEYMDWIDENFKVTVEPKYDNSIIKSKTKDNLIYGEHVDWEWVNDWRRIDKISPNGRHSFWNSDNEIDPIYIDGGSCPFQFKGKNNPFDSKPPIEGCEYSYINTSAHSLVDRLKPYQILHNVYMNKIPKNALNDMDNKLTVDRRSISASSASLEEGLDPLEEYSERLRNSDIITYGATRDQLEGQGPAGIPQVINFSTADNAIKNIQIASMLKDLAGEVVGVGRSRQGGSKASETATGITTNITYNETQTEKYFEQHFNLMKRVRQRMLDAAQYYSTFKPVSREMFMNSKEENILLQMIGMENLLPQYNLILTSTADSRAVLQQISRWLIEENTLPFRGSEKIEALASESVNTMLVAIKKAEAEADQKAQEDHDREMELQQQKIQASQEAQAREEQVRMQEKAFDRETQVQVATIRALGGVQTDANADSQTDASQNLDQYFRQQELQNKQQTDNSKLALDKQKHNDSILMQRETNQAKIEEKKIVAKGNLAVAKQNQNKYDKKNSKR